MSQFVLVLESSWFLSSTGLEHVLNIKFTSNLVYLDQLMFLNFVMNHVAEIIWEAFTEHSLLSYYYWPPIIICQYYYFTLSKDEVKNLNISRRSSFRHPLEKLLPFLLRICFHDSGIRHLFIRKLPANLLTVIFKSNCFMNSHSERKINIAFYIFAFFKAKW